MNGFVIHCGTCGRAKHLCACASPPTVAKVAPPTRTDAIAFRYGVAYCRICGFAAAHCKGHAPVEPSE